MPIKEQKPLAFKDLKPGQVFTMAKNQAGRLLMKVQYMGGLGLSAMNQFGQPRHIAVYLHSGMTHDVKDDWEVVPVGGKYVVNPEDITPGMYNKNEAAAYYKGYHE